MGLFLFFLLAVICLASVLGLIVFRNQIYNALCLIVTFTAMGGIFALMDAPFIAVVQIIIYAGAVMVLFIFVIMMINVRQGFPPEKKKWVYIAASLMGTILIVELVFSVIKAFDFLKPYGTEKLGHPTSLGYLLFTKYLYPFEITSVLIVAALVGAIVLAKKKEEGQT